ncbi:MAG: HAD-IA family hydrolase [Rickettsiales bacterium]|nr:HAD-IA family hydrolase [Rickettsiales bacterium]
MYELSAKRLGVDVSECLFIDDSLINVQGAIKAGMKSFVYNYDNDSIEDFSKRLSEVLD